MRDRIKLPPGRQGAVGLLAGQPYVPYLHSHSELEFNLQVRGACRYLVGDRRYDLRPGSLIWLFPRQEHVLLQRSGDHEMWVAVFRQSLIRRMVSAGSNVLLLRGNPPGEHCRCLAPTPARRLADLLQGIMDMTDSRQMDLFNAAMGHVLLLAWDLYGAASQAATPAIHPAVERAARMIRQHHDPLNMPTVAREAGLSPSHLSRLFKQQTGVPMAHYRAGVCLDRFFKLWGDGHGQKMLPAALEAGFGSYPQFYRIFKRHMRCGPAEYLRGQHRP